MPLVIVAEFVALIVQTLFEIKRGTLLYHSYITTTLHSFAVCSFHPIAPCRIAVNWVFFTLQNKPTLKIEFMCVSTSKLYITLFRCLYSFVVTLFYGI